MHQQTILATPGSPAFLRQLEPGDVLLYSRGGVFGALIKVKTWSRFTHVELWDELKGDDLPDLFPVVGSRNGRGVNCYTPDWHGLALVLRPTSALSLQPARRWFWDHARGQGYDWLGLLNFAYARVVGQRNHKMFCSEFATRWLRRAGLPLFPYSDADTIAPRDFLLTGRLYPVWRSPAEWTRYTRWLDEEATDAEVDR